MRSMLMNVTALFRYEDGSRVAFKNLCVGQVLTQRNPTCDLRSYTGGIQSCLDGWRLLDKDQAVPWQDQPVTTLSSLPPSPSQDALEGS